LDEERKGILLLFLHGAKLIRKEEITPYGYSRKGHKGKGKELWKYPILRLNDIDFSRIKLNPDTKLTFDDLESINLRSAKLSKVNLSGANLRNADLRDADLSGAALRTPNQKEDPEVIPGEKHNEVDKAMEPGTDGKSLPEGLLKTDLSGADLSGADLSSANLKGARVTNKQLAKCKSLKKATMPDGSTHD